MFAHLANEENTSQGNLPEKENFTYVLKNVVKILLETVSFTE